MKCFHRLHYVNKHTSGTCLEIDHENISAAVLFNKAGYPLLEKELSHRSTKLHSISLERNCTDRWDLKYIALQNCNVNIFKGQ